MTSTTLRTLLATVIAATAVTAVPAADARQSGSTSPSGRPCKTDPYGGTMSDGDVTIHRTKYERWTMTCTDGTLCTSIGVKQGNGRWLWRYECEDVPTIR